MIGNQAGKIIVDVYLDVYYGNIAQTSIQLTWNHWSYKGTVYIQ